MECNIVDIKHKIGTPMHIHIYSDIHGQWDRVIPHMRERNKLKNSKFILLGDNDEWILAKDPRYLPSKMPKELLGVDDYIDAAVRMQADRLKEFDLLFISMGNHDFEMLNRHATCPTARLARTLGCLYGGWSGFLRLRFRSTTTRQIKARFNLLYHHGGASGSVTKGMPWAQRFAARHEGWDVFAFGHTHQLWCDHIVSQYMNENGNLSRRPQWIVNTGTWLETYDEGLTPSYGERRGYPPIAMACPLIQVTPLRTNKCKISVTMGNA